MCQHGGATAVAVRLAGDLFSGHSEARRWRSIDNTLQLGEPRANCGNDVVQVLPCFKPTAPRGYHCVAQPAPALLNITLRNEYLERSLCPHFIADECSIRFRECSGRENQFC